MDPTLELLLSRIDDQRKTVLMNLGDGAAKDFASYQNMTGYIRGLSVAEGLIKDLAQRMETDDDSFTNTYFE